MKPLLSIVIPEKDRYKYLFQLVQLIDSYHLSNTEIVIEDNSENNSPWVDFVAKNSFSSHIIYHHTSTPISVRQNCENGIVHSNGEYVCLIGDDDAVMPNIEECVQWMKGNGIDSMRQKTEITYKWPSYIDENIGGYRGATLAYDKCLSYVGIIDAKQAAVNVMHSSFVSLGHCPCVYHGVVSKNTLDKLYAIGSCYIPGPSPDMANAIALSFVVDKFCITDIPFVISGGSEYQGGRSEKVRTWVQPLSKISYISDEDKKKWDPRLPYLWAAETVWPESGIKGLSYVGQKSLEQSIDFNNIIMRILLQVKGRDFIIVLQKAPNKIKVLFLYIKKRIRNILSRYKEWLVGKGILKQTSTRVTINNVMSINEAIEYLEINEPHCFDGIILD